MKKLIFLLSVVLLLISCTQNYTKEEVDRMFEPITSKYGIKIVYEIDEEFAPILIGGHRARFDKIRQIDGHVLARYPAILEAACKKYPVQVIKKYLNAVYLTKEIDQGGFKIAGLYDQFRRIIYLANNGWQPDKFRLAIFHHEFSSLLLNSHGFYVNPWFEHNPKGFKYRREIYKDWKKEYEGGATRASIPAYDQGFLSLYGQTNFENDFNEYSAMIFTYPEKFKKIMNQYPRVRGKFLVWLEFYHMIDPIFTEEYLLGSK